MRSEEEFKAELMGRVKRYRARQQQRKKAVATAAVTAACVLVVMVTARSGLREPNHWGVPDSTRPQTDVSAMSGHPDRETVTREDEPKESRPGGIASVDSVQTVDNQATEDVQEEMVDQIPEEAVPEAGPDGKTIQIQSDGMTVREYTEPREIERLLRFLEEVQSADGQTSSPAASETESSVSRIIVRGEDGVQVIYTSEIDDMMREESDQTDIRYVYLNAEQWEKIKQELAKLPAE